LGSSSIQERKGKSSIDSNTVWMEVIITPGMRAALYAQAELRIQSRIADSAREAHRNSHNLMFEI